jgi:hypothetical protein
MSAPIEWSDKEQPTLLKQMRRGAGTPRRKLTASGRRPDLGICVADFARTFQPFAGHRKTIPMADDESRNDEQLAPYRACSASNPRQRRCE